MTPRTPADHLKQSPDAELAGTGHEDLQGQGGGRGPPRPTELLEWTAPDCLRTRGGSIGHCPFCSSSCGGRREAMNRYGRAWLSACRTLVYIGTALAIFAYPLATTLTLWCFAAGLGAVMTYTVHGRNDKSAQTQCNLLGFGAHNAWAAGWVVLAIAGFAGVLQSLVWLLTILMVLGSPWAIKLFLLHAAPSNQAALSGHSAPPPQAARSGQAAPPGMPEEPVEAVVFAPSVRDLADPGLCWAWRESYQWLEGACSPALHAYVVTLRQAYLDELERRDPSGLQAWLASAPRARSGPDRFFHPGTGGHQLSS